MKPESQIQRQVRQYLAKRGYDAVAVPNGAHLAGDRMARIRQVASMKADGMKPGFPDLVILGRDSRVGFMEIKTPKGVLTQEQRNCRAELERDGHKYALVRSVEDAQAALVAWGWP